MRQLFTFAVATAMLAFGGVATAGGGGGGGGGEKQGDQAKFNTQITLKYKPGPYDPYDPYYEEAVFKGKVTATPANKEARKNPKLGKKCEKDRKVVIKNKSLPNDAEAYAETSTNKEGKYKVSASEAEPGEYQAKALKKRKIKAEVKCFAAKSNRVTVP